MGLIRRLDLTVKALQGIIPYYSVNPREQRILFVVIGQMSDYSETRKRQICVRVQYGTQGNEKTCMELSK